jgi:ribosomal protein L9
LEKKRDLAEEILDQYDEFLDDATEYRLSNNVGDMSMERLFRLQDRLQEEKEEQEREERIDEELEMELAEAVYNDDRFHGRFNTTDVEMLLEQLDVEFDEEEVRIDHIDRKAKSLLKVKE